MKATDIPVDLRLGKDIMLCAPDMTRLEEMNFLIRKFQRRHHFLDAWALETDLDYTARFLVKAIDDFEADKKYIFHIVQRDTGKQVGLIGIHPKASIIKYYHIGYWIGSEHVGRGFATQAVVLARGIVVSLLRPDRLEIVTAQSNIASRRVAEKADFTQECVLTNAIHGADHNPDNAVVWTYAVPKFPKAVT